MLKTRESAKVSKAGTYISRSSDVLIEFNPQVETIAQDCETIAMARQHRVSKKTNEKEAKALMVVAARETVCNLIPLAKWFISLIVTQTTRETAPSHPNDTPVEAFHAHDLPRKHHALCKSVTKPLESTSIPAHKPNSPEI